MAKAKHKVTLADAKPVTVEVGDKTFKLQPTIDAARLMNDYFGGVFSDADQRVQKMDITAVVAIINAGTGGRMTRKQEKDLWGEIWASENQVDIAVKVFEFLSIFRNGGRAVRDEDEDSAPVGDESEEESGNG